MKEKFHCTEEKEIQEICDCIVNEINPLKVFLFGSFASGDYKESSDYDFFVVVSDKEKRRNIDIGRILYAKTISLSEATIILSVPPFSIVALTSLVDSPEPIIVKPPAPIPI